VEGTGPVTNILFLLAEYCQITETKDIKQTYFLFSVQWKLQYFAWTRLHAWCSLYTTAFISLVSTRPGMQEGLQFD
jgi:hypothetical protein